MLQVLSLTTKGARYEAVGSKANYWYSVMVLSQRNVVVNIRDIGVFWLRLAMCEWRKAPVCVFVCE